MSSTTDKASGKIKQLVGGLTGDKTLETKGKIEETKGKAKDGLKNMTDKVNDSLKDK